MSGSLIFFLCLMGTILVLLWLLRKEIEKGAKSEQKSKRLERELDELKEVKKIRENVREMPIDDALINHERNHRP